MVLIASQTPPPPDLSTFNGGGGGLGKVVSPPRALPNMAGSSGFQTPPPPSLIHLPPTSPSGILSDCLSIPPLSPCTHLSSTHACHLHSPPLHLHPRHPPSRVLSSYWMPASTSSCSQPVHHSESEEKGQLQSRQSVLSF
jgi:hypothetical protein